MKAYALNEDLFSTDHIVTMISSYCIRSAIQSSLSIESLKKIMDDFVFYWPSSIPLKTNKKIIWEEICNRASNEFFNNHDFESHLLCLAQIFTHNPKLLIDKIVKDPIKSVAERLKNR